MTRLRFTVNQEARPQGSKTVGRTRSGRLYLREDNRRTMPFREAVASQARIAGAKVHDGDLLANILCTFVRPTSHLKKNGVPKSAAPARPGKADADKIARAVLDALQGIAYRNDRQVCAVAVERRWGDVTKVDIEVGTCPGDGRWVYQEDLR
jgi:Holliday junction resolvase RusA-like endonuclease